MTISTQCWEWKGANNGSGYGRAWVDGRSAYPHRISYEIHYGPIPEGLVIDHLCRNPGCYNPTHLEAVTNRENMMRGKSWVADIVRTGLCMRGHPLAGENLILRPNGWRQCRTCINVARRRRRAELRAGAAYVRGPRARRLAK